MPPRQWEWNDTDPCPRNNDLEGAVGGAPTSTPGLVPSNDATFNVNPQTTDDTETLCPKKTSKRPKAKPI